MLKIKLQRQSLHDQLHLSLWNGGSERASSVVTQRSKHSHRSECWSRKRSISYATRDSSPRFSLTNSVFILFSPRLREIEAKESRHINFILCCCLAVHFSPLRSPFYLLPSRPRGTQSMYLKLWPGPIIQIPHDSLQLFLLKLFIVCAHFVFSPPPSFDDSNAYKNLSFL